ncbi:lysine histidine transporter-like 8 [Senna tora]|uniref:Lysine histidine transporter-like 8 n=1 Tax=Senna tora TaxID=362788 RepID=A0A834TVV4_9FABA|nr:lysine histidine transporter-like 8 [Senna tora]
MEETIRVEVEVDPQDAWLPITQSRNGNAYYSAFHTLTSGIGFQALLLPFAFTYLRWLELGDIKSFPRFHMAALHPLVISSAPRIPAWREKVGKAVALFPIMYLSGGTCVTLIIIGGGSIKIFFQIVCGHGEALTTMEWYLVFTAAAILIAQFRPNLNSLAGVSLLGAITVIAYSTLIWMLSVIKGKLLHVSYHYHPQPPCIFDVWNALGIIAFTFRGHNLVLEIQGSMPSDAKQPSHLVMWRGVKYAYLIIASCLFPLAIGGYWAYGNLIPSNGGMLGALHQYHEHDTSKFILASTSFLVVINSLCSFQIYAMPVFDNLESTYTSKNNKPCPRWLRMSFRAFFGCLTFFISVALPFLPSLAGLLGGIALPITLVYPSFMWIKINKPQKYSTHWCLNWTLGTIGMLLSVLVVTGAIWGIAARGINTNFFNPH